MSSNLDKRYGRTSGTRLRDRRVLWIVAGAFAVILTAWVVWAGLDGAGPSIEARDTRHSIIDENNISVTFEVSLPTGSPSSCAVQALNESFTVVGWTVIDLPPSDQYTRSFTEVLHTTELSNTGLIYRCWLT
ncbi:DUF4307 domain-containing protein [Cryobacterium sp. PAMC25264]|uniref:DUF4307 domain-containing protein n=1 Tax=Cryobacterium sp. PAMC25264 TaxID=2861288 RepID=UPI001C631480|nr:DUF4307 domain-containing protein [Cryobacterium sp. PAMC25264]QYF72149.1 DUF4307 domain-containing protein [Cryobacterium sp. PAMC25264]